MLCIFDGRLRKRSFEVFEANQLPKSQMHVVCRMLRMPATQAFKDNFK